MGSGRVWLRKVSATAVLIISIMCGGCGGNVDMPRFHVPNQIGNLEYNLVVGRAAKQEDWLVLVKESDRVVLPIPQLVLYSMSSHNEIVLAQADTIGDISIVGDNVFYRKGLKGEYYPKLFVYNLESRREKSLISGNIDRYNSYKDKIYYLEYEDSGYQPLKAYDLKTKETSIVADGNVRCFSVFDGLVFFFDEERMALMRLDIDTKAVTEIYRYEEGYIDNVIALNDTEIMFRSNPDDGESVIHKLNMVSNEIQVLYDDEQCWAFHVDGDNMYLFLSSGIVKFDYERLEGETIVSFGESISDVAFFDSCIVVHYFEINKPFPKSFIVIYDYDGNVLDSI